MNEPTLFYVFFFLLLFFPLRRVFFTFLALVYRVLQSRSGHNLIDPNGWDDRAGPGKGNYNSGV
jgi:hypothetical protein